MREILFKAKCVDNGEWVEGYYVCYGFTGKEKSYMECYEDIDNKIPSYFQGRVVSFRFAQRNWAKIAVKAKWLYEWIDDETGPESDYIECEKNFSILLSAIGKTVFLTREKAEKKLEEMKKNG